MVINKDIPIGGFMISFLIILMIISVIILIFFAVKYRKSTVFSTKTSIYFRFFYGLSKHLYERYMSFEDKVSIPYTISSSKLYSRLRQLYPGENTMSHYENLIITNISLCMCGYIIGVIFITLIYLSNLSDGTITTLTRPNFNSPANSHNLTVSVNGKKSDISLTLQPKVLTTNEILDIFDSLHNDIEKSLLDENSSLEHVDKKLNFVYSISNEFTGNSQVTIHWKVADNTLINYNGSLIYENISEKGITTTVYATLQLEKYDFTATKEFEMTLYPEEQSHISQLTDEINNIINSEKLLSKKEITLPKNSSFGKLSYYKEAEKFPIIVFPLLLLTLILMVYSRISKLKEQVQKRNDELLHDYPEIISKLTLLYCAGLNIQNAFRRIASDYEKSNSGSRYAYEEIKLMLKSIDNGTNEAVAYTDFGHNCIHPCYIKLGNLLSQNLRRGSAEIYPILEYEAMNSLQEKKAHIKISGEKASTKALVPMVLMLLVVFIMIIAPAFMSI